ncbi:MAG TPA: inositol monophosphatase [Vicinamibacteria bacterium]|nr:inositol monophosphatase [Vicinamibacteria bacterium]
MKLVDLLDPIRELHAQIREAVVAAFARRELEELSSVARDEEGDTLYAIDRVGESVLRDFFERASLDEPVVLIAEGLEPDGKIVVPRSASENDAAFRVVIDPIDGTRGAMYQKRSAWILTGVAPNRGPDTSLRDIELAVQTEIPLIKQHLSDAVWAFSGGPVDAERYNRLSGETRPLRLHPSTAETIEHGFAGIARFFPGARDELAAIDEEIVRAALGPSPRGKALCFEDQYICTGGQLHELFSGRDRFVADLRPLMAPLLSARGFPLGICVHPYDVCTELIARELGVVVTDVYGAPLSAPLDVGTDVSWVGYANENIRRQIEPLLREALRRRGLWS